MVWKIVLTKSAEEMLLSISDRRLQEIICNRIEGLKVEPEKQGKALLGNLAGFRTLRAGGQRYRIIYTVENAIVTVVIVAVGIRNEGSSKDVYKLAQRLVRLGLLDEPGK